MHGVGLRERERLPDEAAYALAQVSRVLPDIENDLQELRQILTLELKRRTDEEMTELVARSGTDPAAYEQLRQLIEARKNKPGAAKGTDS